MQDAGYFVLLAFVGLSGSALSIARVQTRIHSGGHGVPVDKLLSRFERTQTAIRAASQIADACIMLDNSRGEKDAFTVCRIQLREEAVFDLREADTLPPTPITAWLDVLSPRTVA